MVGLLMGFEEKIGPTPPLSAYSCTQDRLALHCDCVLIEVFVLQNYN